MKRIQLTLLASVAISTFIFILFSCNSPAGCVKGSGNSTTDNRKVGSFTKINILGDYKITLKQDSSMAVNITADDNLMQYIKTAVSNDTLTISTDKSVCSPANITINIGLGQLQALITSGKENISTNGTINAQNLSLQLAGADSAAMSITAVNLTTGITGQSTLSLTGQATTHAITVSGNGTLTALDFPVHTFTTQTSGQGNYQVNVADTLSLHTTGASVVKYKGSPTSITNDNKGSSTVQKIN